MPGAPSQHGLALRHVLLLDLVLHPLLVLPLVPASRRLSVDLAVELLGGCEEAGAAELFCHALQRGTARPGQSTGSSVRLRPGVRCR